VIYNPLEEYENKFREAHMNNTVGFLEKLISESGIDIEENRKTVAKYNTYKDELVKMKRKLNLWRFLRVLMCIFFILIPLVILKITPKIRGMREEIQEADKNAEELLSLAYRQMLPLNSLFTDRDALNIIQTTIPLISFDPCFSVDKEADMKINYDFTIQTESDESTLELLSGN